MCTVWVGETGRDAICQGWNTDTESVEGGVSGMMRKKEIRSRVDMVLQS